MAFYEAHLHSSVMDVPSSTDRSHAVSTVSIEDAKFFEDLRENDVSLPSSITYMDYAGASLTTKSQMKACFDELVSSGPSSVASTHPFLTNPHSGGKLGHYTSSRIDAIRKRILEFTHTSSVDYDVVFTANATASLKLVGENFCWSSKQEDRPVIHTSASEKVEKGCLCYAMNSHTSVVGLRQFAPKAMVLPVEALFGELLTQDEKETSSTASSTVGSADITTANSLFVVPAECNFSGSRIDIDAVGRLVAARGSGSGEAGLEHWFHKHGATNLSTERADVGSWRQHWYWCLDASKYLSTSELDLSAPADGSVDVRPHFVVFSLYKIFGYPTGVGVLMVKRECFRLLKKRYFGGGTVATVTADRDFVVFAHDGAADRSGRGDCDALDDIHDSFEDGTCNYHGIAAAAHGFDMIRHYGGMRRIGEYVAALTGHLLSRMLEMAYDADASTDGSGGCSFVHSTKLFVVYSLPADGQYGGSRHGPVITFNCLSPAGEVIGYDRVYKHLCAHDVVVRAGCFCNMGACQSFLQLTADDVISNYQSGRTCAHSSGDEDADAVSSGGLVTDVINGKPTGAIRVSLGMYSTLAECKRFVSVMSGFMSRVVEEGRAGLAERRRQEATRAEWAEAAAAATAAATVAPARIAPVAVGIPAGVHGVASFPSEEPLYQAVSPQDRPIISRMFLYPIKSCGSFEVTKWPVSRNGLLFDREFVLVRAPRPGAATDSAATHLVITQKSYPMLSLLKPVVLLHLDREPSGLAAVMVVHAPMRTGSGSGSGSGAALPPLHVPLFMPADDHQEVEQESETGRGGSGASTVVNVCGRRCGGRLLRRRASDVAAEADRWFSHYLGVGVMLVRSTLFQKRSATVEPTAADACSTGPAKVASGLVNYVNDAPFLLVSMASVAHLREVLRDVAPETAATVSVEQFRPNIVISTVRLEEALQSTPGADIGDDAGGNGLSGHIEDSWRAFSAPAKALVGGAAATMRNLRFNILGPCARCSMINVNQGLGLLTSNLLSSLAYRKIRKGSAVSEPTKRVDNNVYFGQFCNLSIPAAAGSDSITGETCFNLDASLLYVLEANSSVDVNYV